jgi:hypothetical protein
MNVGLRPRKTNRLRVRDEVDLMPTLAEFEPEFCGNYAAAPVRRVAGYPYVHPYPYGAPASSLHATEHSMAYGEQRCSFWSPGGLESGVLFRLCGSRDAGGVQLLQQ